ncbi:hypothetical protein YC2023_051160 [Brassica napus]|uniref:RNase H type-1 domain-containing protein n=1 Tax=Brassica oleracea TaxID=3712 RepID=A0A3P6C6B6_BRAOL|nr:unnamed protein product [Brassica oleracea]
MVDGSWPCTSIFSGCRWVWKDTSGQTQLMGIRNQRRREFSLHLELEALYWAMDNMLHHSKFLGLFIRLFVLFVILSYSSYPKYLKFAQV